MKRGEGGTHLARGDVGGQLCANGAPGGSGSLVKATDRGGGAHYEGVKGAETRFVCTGEGCGWCGEGGGA